MDAWHGVLAPRKRRLARRRRGAWEGKTRHALSELLTGQKGRRRPASLRPLLCAVTTWDSHNHPRRWVYVLSTYRGKKKKQEMQKSHLPKVAHGKPVSL